MIHFKRIGDRLLVSVCSVVVIGLVVMVLVNAVRQERVILREAEASLAKITDSVAEGFIAIMLGGHAKVAPDFAERLGKMPDIVDYRIIRSNGIEAFVDNTTIEKVNKRLNEARFTGHIDPAEPREVLAAGDPNLARLRQTGERTVAYQTLPGGERLVTMLTPIKGVAECEKCHEAGEAIRGVVKLTMSLREADLDIERTWQISLMVIVAAMLGIAGLIYWAAQRMLVSRIVKFSHAMETAATGDMSVRLPVLGKDELGRMAQSFNHMNEELLVIYDRLREERNKLSTVIQGASSGIVVTNAQRHVVLVNNAAERMLGKTEEQIVEQGFDALLDDPGWMVERLARQREQSISEILPWKNLLLSVQISTIHDATGKVIGSAALMRDVTEEQRLENELKARSITDALTGLKNRRLFDEALQTEFRRWRRYGLPVSLLMLDIDHFKRFNDTHGHECGDRVLIAIGAVLLGIVSPSVIPCRYGGEEMVVIMPGSGQEKAVELAERVRLLIAELVIDGLRVTVSIGAAGCPGHAVEDADALVKLADSALYVAKEGGRNRVCAAEPTAAAKS